MTQTQKHTNMHTPVLSNWVEHHHPIAESEFDKQNIILQEGYSWYESTVNILHVKELFLKYCVFDVIPKNILIHLHE